MARRKNTDFRLGLDRKQLIEAAQVYGKNEKSAKKANTKTLENFVIKQIIGKKAKFPTLSDDSKRNIQDSAKGFGIRDALKQLTYKAQKETGMRNEDNFLRLAIQDGFSLFYDGIIKPEHIDELENRVTQSTVDMSGLIKISPFYRNLFIDYAEELEEKERQQSG